MINFATLQGVAIPEGVVTKIESGGVVIWKLNTSGPIVLEVEKITATTYAGETSYASESFVLLDIYPKASDSVISVTYGGLTKTLQFSGTNAQKVYFGTFNGVSDSMETPASGTLTIEGDCLGFGCGGYTPDSKGITSYCFCVTNIVDFGSVQTIPGNAFGSLNVGCKKIESVTTPQTLESIGGSAFVGCVGLKTVTMKNGVRTIGGNVFNSCTALEKVVIPKSLESVGDEVYPYLFNNCNMLESIEVDPDNMFFSSEGGAFFNKDKSHLISFTGAKGHYTVPASVGSIARCAFYGATRLTSVTIPQGVGTIGSSAFYGCTNLTSVIMLASVPPTLDDAYVFDNTTCTITVPSGCGEAYKAAENWSEYADRIVEG